MKKTCIFYLLILSISSAISFVGCVPVDGTGGCLIPTEDPVVDPAGLEIGEDGHPVGWEKESHGKGADPNYALLFDQKDVLRFDIVIAPSDWQAMLDDMTAKFGFFGAFGGRSSMSSFDPREASWNWGGDENPIYVRCSLVFKGITWHHVGIRFKGSSSLMSTWKEGSYKLPLRLTFDKFEDEFPEIKNQRFYGFKKLGLSSGAFDNSLVREKVTNEIFRSAGVPVGRDAFCKVYIDYGQGKKYFGLYTLQEIPAKPMLKSLFMDDDGNLYKPEGDSASFRTWNPEDFDKETNEKEADFSDVHELYEILHSDHTDEAAFRQRLESAFDVDGFLHYLAINQVICNWDTYGNLPHNYFLYHDPGDDLIHWIPFDFNFALETVGLMPAKSIELGPLEVTQKWPLIRHLLDIDDYHARYVDYVKKTIDETFYPQRMQTILADTYDLIKPSVVEEAAPYSNLTNMAAFDRAFKLLNTHVTNRYRTAQRFVNRYQKEVPPADENDTEVSPPEEGGTESGPADKDDTEVSPPEEGGTESGPADKDDTEVSPPEEGGTESDPAE